MAEDKWKRDLWKIIDDGARIIYDFALHRLSTKDGTFIYYIWASENFQMTFFFCFLPSRCLPKKDSSMARTSTESPQMSSDTHYKA